jgi:hypothetical protein
LKIRCSRELGERKRLRSEIMKTGFMIPVLGSMKTLGAVLAIASIALAGCGPDEEPRSTASVSLDPTTTLRLAPNGTHDLTATATGTTSALQWTTSDSSVVTVEGNDKTARVTAGARVGTATVTVSASGNAVSASCAVTVAVAAPTWTQAADTALESGGVSSILYDGSKFIAAATNGKMASSPNGETWTAVASPFGDSYIHDIAWNGSIYVAVGAAGKIAASADGSTWTLFTGTSPFGTNTIYAVAGGSASSFVAVGHSGIIAAWDGAADAWTAAETTGRTGTEALNDVAYGGNSFTAVGYNPASGSQSVSAVILSSTDGRTWVETMTAQVPIYLKTVTYGNGSLVVVGGSTSSEGIIFTGAGAALDKDTTFGTSAINDVAYCHDHFIAVGGNGKMAVSSDGLTWTAVAESSFGTRLINRAAYGGGVYVAGGSSGMIAYSSTGR